MRRPRLVKVEMPSFAAPPKNLYVVVEILGIGNAGHFGGVVNAV